MAEAMKFLCVSTVPLLAPVVPDEYRIAAASVCMTVGSDGGGGDWNIVLWFRRIQGRLKCLILW